MATYPRSCSAHRREAGVRARVPCCCLLPSVSSAFLQVVQLLVADKVHVLVDVSQEETNSQTPCSASFVMNGPCSRLLPGFDEEETRQGCLAGGRRRYFFFCHQGRACVPAVRLWLGSVVLCPPAGRLAARQMSSLCAPRAAGRGWPESFWSPPRPGCRKSLHLCPDGPGSEAVGALGWPHLWSPGEDSMPLGACRAGWLPLQFHRRCSGLELPVAGNELTHLGVKWPAWFRPGTG